MAYSSETKIENMFGIDITGGKSTALVDILAAVKLFIDRYVGKTFEAVSETRYYDWNGSRSIEIDAFVGSATILILNPDGTTNRSLTVGGDHDYIIQPYNTSDKYNILLTESGWNGQGFWWWGLPSGTKAIAVTATFGQSTTVPADIQFVATKLAGLLLQENNEGILKSITLGDYSASFDTIENSAHTMGIYDILDSYRDIDI